MEKIKIDYIRNLNGSYMLLPQKGELLSFEQNILAYNTVDGIVVPVLGRENEQGRLWYDITGMRSLEVVLENTLLGQELLRRLLVNFCEAAEKVEELLLQQADLLLEQECIFLDNRTEQFLFCYYPGNGRPVAEAFQKLMEYLLTRIDHKDECAVKAAYQLYEQTLKEGYCLSDIRDCIMLLREAGAQPEVHIQPEKNMEPDETAGGKAETKHQPDKKTGVLMPDFYVKKVHLIKTHMAQAAGTVLDSVRDKFCFKRSRAEGKKYSVKQDRELIFEPEEEVRPVNRPTVLLSDLGRRPRGILRYEGNGACHDLEITESPFFIGSEKSCAGYIPSTTVSRCHAKITKQEEIYFLEDLNSSNGTYVGGELLNCKVKMSLNVNETVVFADEKFRFI